MQPTPRNKLYMTREDFTSYNDEIARVYRQLHPKEEDKEDDMLCKDVTFCVTEACNLACTYCYECHKTSRRMSWETAKRIVDGLFAGEFVDNSAPAIILDFIGGEPLLEIELIDKTVEYFKRKAFQLRHPWAYYYMISISKSGSPPIKSRMMAGAVLSTNSPANSPSTIRLAVSQLIRRLVLWHS